MSSCVKEGRKERILVTLGLPIEIHRQVRAIANDLGVSMSAWLLMAIHAYLRRWRPAKDNAAKLLAWSKCQHCGKRHDPEEHFAK